MKQLNPRLIFLLAMSIFIAGCNKPPKADAGADTVAFERSRVTIEGSATDPNKKDKLTYAWRQLNGEMLQDLEGQDSPRFSFTLPSVSSDETIGLSLTVTDSAGEKATDTVDIKVKAYAALAKLQMKDKAFEDCAKTKLYYLAWDDMGNANTLDCSSTNTELLQGIENLPNLQELVLANNNISSLSAIQTLRHLRRLNVSENNISHFSYLSLLRELRYLSAVKNPVQSLKGLEKLYQLEELYLGKTGLTDDELKFIQHLKKLKILYLNDNRIKHINYLVNLDGLEQLYLHNNNIVDPSPLLNLEKVKRIYLEGNSSLDCKTGKSLKAKFGNRVTLPRHCQ